VDVLNLGLREVFFLNSRRHLQRLLKAFLILDDGSIAGEHAALKFTGDFDERLFARVTVDFSIEERVPEIHDQFGIRSCSARLFQISRRRDAGRRPGPEAPA